MARVSFGGDVVVHDSTAAELLLEDSYLEDPRHVPIGHDDEVPGLEEGGPLEVEYFPPAGHSGMQTPYATPGATNRSLGTAYSNRSASTAFRTHRSTARSRLDTNRTNISQSIFTPALTASTKRGLTQERAVKNQKEANRVNKEEYEEYIKDSGLQVAFKKIVEHALVFPPRDIWQFVEQQLRFLGDPFTRAILKRRRLRLGGAKRATLDRRLFDTYEKPGVVLVVTMADASSIVQRFGATHAGMLFVKLNQIVASVIAEFATGQILKVDEDQTFARFPTSEVTVKCGLAILEAVSRWNALQTHPVTFLDVTLAASMGRTLVLRDDIYGDAVNIAYKLGKEVAKGGEFLISADMLTRLNIDGRKQLSRRFTERQNPDESAQYFWTTVVFDHATAKFKGFKVAHVRVTRIQFHNLPILRPDYQIPGNQDNNQSTLSRMLLDRFRLLPNQTAGIDRAIAQSHTLSGFFLVTHVSRMSYLTKKHGILHPLSTMFRHRGDAIGFIVGHGGHVVKYDGDHIIARFQQAQDAVEAGLDVLEYVMDFINVSPQGDPLESEDECQSYIGISQGTVLHNAETNDVYGHALSEAFELSERGLVPNTLMVTNQVCTLIEAQPRYYCTGVQVPVREDWTMYATRVARDKSVPLRAQQQPPRQIPQPQPQQPGIGEPRVAHASSPMARDGLPPVAYDDRPGDVGAQSTTSSSPLQGIPPGHGLGNSGNSDDMVQYDPQVQAPLNQSQYSQHQQDQPLSPPPIVPHGHLAQSGGDLGQSGGSVTAETLPAFRNEPLSRSSGGKSYASPNVKTLPPPTIERQHTNVSDRYAEIHRNQGSPGPVPDISTYKHVPTKYRTGVGKAGRVPVGP